MTMPNLRVLQVEDSESDAALIVRLLEKTGHEVQSERVEDATGMRAALAKQDWDVIIADHSLPQFDAPGALRIAGEIGKDIPFIVVSGNIGEELAVAMMKSGAHDYILKDNLSRLAPAVEREIREAGERRERKRMEERLRQSQKMESIGLLASGVAHDFNNLLTGIIGGASMAQDMIPYGNPAVEMLQQIVKAGEQAAHLTRQLLAYAGKGQFFVAPVNLSRLVGEAASLIQSSVSKKISFHLELDPSVPAVESDASQLQQIFMNLALNAAEAIGDNPGVISIRTGEAVVDPAYAATALACWPLEPGRFVFLEVRDTGCGMDEDTRGKIFDPFFTTKFQGRGLGLAAVSGIVCSHKGAIEVTTAPRAGTTFRVFLPAANARAADQSPPAGRPAAPSGHGTVLVVDDEEIVRNVARNCLERQGYQVLVAASGPAAIDIVRNHGAGISLVLLDWSMPGMNGEEVLPRLREIHPALKVVVSSGYGESEARRVFRGATISGFVQKPYTVQTLAEIVKTALE